MNHCIIVGAQRSGSTYLFKLLEEHPEVCVSQPSKPEPKYFLHLDQNLNKDEYLNKYFSNCEKGKRIYLEKSTSYYESKEAASNINRILPQAKILFVLRDPVERALSNYFFSLNNGLETRSLKEVFLDNIPPPKYNRSEISVNPFDYLGRGEYLNYIKTYLDYFSRENVKVVILEELLDSVNTIQAIYSFLGIYKSYVPSNLNQKINMSQRNEEVIDVIKVQLKEYYKKHNFHLESLLHQTLTNWN
ncbi:sulfotransferase family protein [Namhaeicola litoreus]|uniref:Sulfotransferase family protein n=1 Tax=Namhaeicola litoreus TaxID=1052145 RepID=A0ABW3Y4C0_9FLAO